MQTKRTADEMYCASPMRRYAMHKKTYTDEKTIELTGDKVALVLSSDGVTVYMPALGGGVPVAEHMLLLAAIAVSLDDVTFTAPLLSMIKHELDGYK